MASGSLLLRVLLVIALLANGTAGAATTLPATSGMHVHHHAMAERGCHEHGSMHHGDTAASVAMKGHPAHPASCCSTGHCRCDGVPSLPGVVDSGSSPSPCMRSLHEVRVALAERTDPALPHLIRPPIGQAVFQRP